MDLLDCGTTEIPPLALFRSLPLLKGPFCEAPVRQEPPACLVPSLTVGASRPGGHNPDVALIKQSFSFVRGLQR